MREAGEKEMVQNVKADAIVTRFIIICWLNFVYDLFDSFSILPNYPM